MDPRRASRSVIGPKVRQVGFFTPDSASASTAAAAPPGRSHSLPLDAIPSVPPASDISRPGISLSPVMIPPPRHASADAAVAAAAAACDASELLLPTPPVLSPSSRFEAASEYSEDGVPAWIGDGRAPGGKSNLAAASAGEIPSSASEKNKAKLVEKPNEELGISVSQKPKTSKAERRAIQEAQRAAKAAAAEAAAASGGMVSTSSKLKSAKSPLHKKDGPQLAAPVTSDKMAIDYTPVRERKKDVPPPRMQFDDIPRVEKAKRRAVVNKYETRSRVELFQHLPQYEHGTQLPYLEAKFFQLDPMHPSVYKVGLQNLSSNISGGNARCMAMLLAFREAISDYSTPPEKALARDLTAKISSYVSFLIECRPLSISMGNAIRFLKNRIAKLPHTLSESEAKSSLQSDIDRFINEKIVLADTVIIRHAVTKIRDGDVLLTYGLSSVVEMILLYAHELRKQFRVVVIDSRPKLEGQTLLRRLVGKGVSCTYTHINAISYIMHKVTRVFLGASSVLSNGTVYSRVGTACIAMVAHAYRVPVLVCCEAYKFHERVQLDSICSNELGDPDIISKVSGREDINHLTTLDENENLQLLNLLYDATPSDYVSMIITDYGMLPPTSVPVIVREYRREQLWM